MSAESGLALRKYAWISIAAAIATIGLKLVAWLLTGSVGLLSDAAESVVNLVAAVVALVALTIAAKPADHNHHFGHHKAEYFSAAIEGVLIFGAAVVILVSAISRLLHPQPLERVGIGLALTLVATAINGAVGVMLIRAGRKTRSPALTSDGHHLLTDVWTSVGVVVGVFLVWLTGWERLDPIVALIVGLNICWIGWKLVAQSSAGLMDHALPAEVNAEITTVLASFTTDEVHFHQLRTRESGRHRFAEVHVLVPGEWTVQQGHDLIENVEAGLREKVPDLTVLCHLEPSEDPRSYENVPDPLPVRRTDPS